MIFAENRCPRCRIMRCPSPRKHGLELSRDGSPCESRGRSAGRRARPVWRAAAQQTSCAEGADLRLRRAAHGWHAPFGASPPFLCRRQIRFCAWSYAELGRAGAARPGSFARHCERQRSNPEASASGWIASSRSLLAMTRLGATSIPHTRHPAIRYLPFPPPTPPSCRSRMVPTRKRARCPWAFA
jgi:hypothetical protein